MQSLQTIRKHKVTNYYTFGRKLQKWCNTNINLILDTAGCGYSDGGCRVLAEALIKWSNNYLVQKSYSSSRGSIEHVVATFQDRALNTYILDADGMGSVQDGVNKLYVLENIKCGSILKNSVGTISDYKLEFPDLINDIATKLETDLGKFKPTMLVASSKIELPTHKIIDKTIIQNLEYTLDKFENYHTIPTLQNVKDAIDLLITPIEIKPKTPPSYFEALKYVTIRDNLTISEDDYIYALKKYFKIHDLVDFVQVSSLLPTWGKKVDKFFIQTIKDDLWKLEPNDQITLCYQIENRIGSKQIPVVEIIRDEEFTTFQYQGEFLFKTNTKFAEIEYLQDIYKRDPEEFKKLLKTENNTKSILLNLLVYMLKTNNTLEFKNIIKEYIVLDSFMYMDFYDLLTLCDIQKTDVKMKDVILEALNMIQITDKHKLIFESNVIPLEWINEYFSQTDKTIWFDTLYRYPSVLNKLTDSTRLKIVENLILRNYTYFHNFDPDIEDEFSTTDDCILKVITLYIGHIPKISNMINMAKALDPMDAFKQFKDLYASTSIIIDEDVALPEIF